MRPGKTGTPERSPRHRQHRPPSHRQPGRASGPETPVAPRDPTRQTKPRAAMRTPSVQTVPNPPRDRPQTKKARLPILYRRPTDHRGTRDSKQPEPREPSPGESTASTPSRKLPAGSRPSTPIPPSTRTWRGRTGSSSRREPLPGMSRSTAWRSASIKASTRSSTR